jgi:predicted transposase YdaD
VEVAEHGNAPQQVGEQAEDFYGRWLSGIFLYLHRHRVSGPWWTVVVFPDRATDVAPTAPIEGLLHSGQVQRVYLEDLLYPPTGIEMGLGLRLARLVVLDREQTPAEARTLIDALARFTPSERDAFIDLIETIVVYKLTELSREEIRQMLHLPETDLKKTRFYQDVFGEGRQEGWQEGRREGRQEGWQEGRREGRREGRAEEALNLVQRQLQRRIGGLTPQQESRLRSLDTPRLEALGEALLDFLSPDDLEAWLRPR